MARRGFAILFTLLGVAFFISIAGFAALYLLFGREPAVPSNATLVLRVGGDPRRGRAQRRRRLPARRRRRRPCAAIVDNLRKAKVDARIRAVLLKPTGFESPFWGKVQELRDAVLDFKKSGKPIYAYLEYGGDREYYLATAADKVFLMPSSPLDLTGVATYELFLRGTLDKIGAYPGPASHRRLQDRRQHLHREGLHAGAPRDGPSRSTATSTSSSCAASPTAGRRTRRRSAR